MFRRMVIDHLRRGRGGSDADVLQLSETVVPMPEASMRILEFVIATAALGFAVFLGMAR